MDEFSIFRDSFDYFMLRNNIVLGYVISKKSIEVDKAEVDLK